MEQFKNINYDNDNAYDPAKGGYGTPEKREVLMTQIEDALEANKQIVPDAVCNMPESVIHIPISDPKDCCARQYPLAINVHKEIEKQIHEWLQNKIVKRCKPSSDFHSPLLAVGKKDESNDVTKLRIRCDLRKINENVAIPEIQEIFERVSANACIISKIDLFHAHFSRARASFGLAFMSSKFAKCMSILLEGIHRKLQYDMEKIHKRSSITDISDNRLNGKLTHPAVRCAKSHVIPINSVLKRLTNENLKINVAKCTWFRTSIFLLSFVVGPCVTKLDMRRLSNVDSWPNSHKKTVTSPNRQVAK
ncbi:hypothetical protein [Parasitella parasitica]|uniref:Reverse transcriptase domain-containing protein n=1 Tax=Parasitella parasitica TaxID=35722 RepID=A0A0B7MXI2_9FUNG|nr:hypothetical protein [Parasitella parasitica]